MSKYERRILELLDRYLLHIILVLVSVLAIFIRYRLRTLTSVDSHVFLVPWYDEIMQNSLYEQVGNYGILYQLLIWVMTKFPFIPSLYAYKILSCLFDYALAATVGMTVYELADENRSLKGTIAYCITLLIPSVYINSAAWAQCDSIFTTFALLSAFFLIKEKYNMAFIMLGISFSFKLQAVFVLPFFLFFYFVKRKFSALKFLLVPITMVVTSLPIIFWGRSPLETFTVYMGQTKDAGSMALGYPSIWMLMFTKYNKEQYAYMASVGILLTMCMLAFFMGIWINKKYRLTGVNIFIMLFLLTYSTVFFLPAMHERYGYVYEIMTIVLALVIPKTTPLAGTIIAVSACMYGDFLFITPADARALVWFNLFAYVGYFLVLTNEMNKRIDCLEEGKEVINE